MYTATQQRTAVIFLELKFLTTGWCRMWWSMDKGESSSSIPGELRQQHKMLLKKAWGQLQHRFHHSRRACLAEGSLLIQRCPPREDKQYTRNGTLRLDEWAKTYRAMYIHRASAIAICLMLYTAKRVSPPPPPITSGSPHCMYTTVARILQC